ncbi:hypothetical protein [Oleiagrimonas sp. MCCC 1A03011]|uniref:hypothetical protein n=1 Tax=Oleiagrimonas sp. MCCC 1A03011 TaxID=1926883 RepID=UPI000DC45B5F|nr:hypothetical protein [Oleiagrimonas sp. MCCC 1A03011]RAP57176.1 hypothetical protein BTJ49_11520 [Oleiagrimonas sp. MCCC 1A03011]
MFDFATNNETMGAATANSSKKALVHAFIERLSRDDEFRAYTEANPIAAAAQYGFDMRGMEVPEGGIVLPSKTVLCEHLDAIARKIAESAVPVKYFRI